MFRIKKINIFFLILTFLFLGKTGYGFGQEAPIQSQPLKDEIVSLRFGWNAPVNMATFGRNNKIWIVFDRPNRMDVETLKSEA